MLFNWDPAKAEQNIKKHGISFEIAQTAFDDPFHMSLLDAKKHSEERWITLGRSADLMILVIVHMYSMSNEGQEQIRIISARKATRKEIKEYEEGI